MSPEAVASVAGRGAAGATCSATAVSTVAAARAAWSCEVVGAGAAGAGAGRNPARHGSNTPPSLRSTGVPMAARTTPAQRKA